jgi:hypothetical protein
MLGPAPVRFAGRIAVAALLAAGLAGTLSARPAAAQSKAELSKAREQFREAIALEAGGNCARALEMFKAIAEVKSTPQVRMHIAQCEEKLGDYIKALGSYRLALVDAQAAKLSDVIELANESIEALEPKIPAITVQRGDGATLAQITVDQRPLGANEVGSKVLLNPGPHVIEAKAEGRKPFRQEIVLADGDKKAIEVRLGGEGDLGPIGDHREPYPDPVPVPPPPPAKTSPVRTAGFVIGGVGIAGLAVAGAFIGLRQGTLSELETSCGKDHKSCPAGADTLIARGEMESTVATGTLIGGGVALAAGIVLVIVAPKSAAPAAARLGLTPGVAGAQKGATLSFAF